MILEPVDENKTSHALGLSLRAGWGAADLWTKHWLPHLIKSGLTVKRSGSSHPARFLSFSRRYPCMHALHAYAGVSGNERMSSACGDVHESTWGDMCAYRREWARSFAHIRTDIDGRMTIVCSYRVSGPVHQHSAAIEDPFKYIIQCPTTLVKDGYIRFQN